MIRALDLPLERLSCKVFPIIQQCYRLFIMH